MTMIFQRLSRAVLTWSVALIFLAAPLAAAPLPGVNIAGAEFGQPGGRIGVDYRYAEPRELDYFIAKGFKLFRVPFLASRLLEGPPLTPVLRESDAAPLERLADHLAARGAIIVIDLHAYGRTRFGQPIADALTTQLFATSWRAIATRFMGRRNVAFGLMNEPAAQTPREWAQAANAAVAAIREVGARNLILVPGGMWSTASDWMTSGNAQAMLDVVDPADNFMIEAHQYLDPDSTGKRTEVVAGAGATRLAAFTQWARAHRKRAYLGEFGFADTPQARTEARAMLSYMARNADVWKGWTAWSAGRWWGDYPFSLEPRDGRDAPGMKVLEEFIPRRGARGRH